MVFVGHRWSVVAIATGRKAIKVDLAAAPKPLANDAHVTTLRSGARKRPRAKQEFTRTVSGNPFLFWRPGGRRPDRSRGTGVCS